MNYAENLVNETETNQEEWTSEDFKEWLYSNNTPEKSHNLLENSGKEVSGFWASSFNPEISFKFNYIKDKQEDPLEELGIEVIE